MADFLPYLLLVPAVWFGWWVAKNYQGRITRRRNRLFNDQYFQGLNYLLNEQPDKAIQVFLELADVNQETVETHLALGNLFRRRGVLAARICCLRFGNRRFSGCSRSCLGRLSNV